MNRWKRWLPGLQILSDYQAAWFAHDLMAGLVLTTMLVPVGIAYALASGVPGIYGLYATIVPLLAYALFGPSRILVLGPDSSLAAVILAVVFPLSGGDPMRAVALAATASRSCLLRPPPAVVGAAAQHKAPAAKIKNQIFVFVWVIRTLPSFNVQSSLHFRSALHQRMLLKASIKTAPRVSLLD
jgi:hypothetical protein